MKKGDHAIVSNTGRGNWGERVQVRQVLVDENLVLLQDDGGNELSGSYHIGELTPYQPDMGVRVKVDFKPWLG